MEERIIMKKLSFLLFLFILLAGANLSIRSENVYAEDNLQIKMPKKLTIKHDDFKRIFIDVYYNGECVTELCDYKVARSNKNITIFDDNEGFCYGDRYDIMISNNKAGKSTLTVSVEYTPTIGIDDEEGEPIRAKAKCLIKCQKEKLSKKLKVDASLDYYNTRENYFSMSIRNSSKKTITILSNGAMAYDDDYKSFDRSLKLTRGRSQIKIKPGKSATVNYKVIGSLTWNDVSDFQIGSYWIWNGKKYWVTVYDEEAWYKSGKKWKEIS